MSRRKGRTSGQRENFSWGGVFWTIVMGLAMYALIYLQKNMLLSEQQLTLLILIGVPVAALLVSGQGCDDTQE